MGCCISKCRPDDKHSQLEGHDQFNHVHDKLVISQASPPTSSSSIIPHHSSSNKISPSPPSPTSSTSSISSFTCTTTSNNTISSTTSSLSSANSSSALTSKDRSFSNEFLWSCYKDNPHIIRINSLREATTTLHSMPTKPNYKAQPSRNIKPSSPKHSSAPLKLSPPQNVFSMPQKRVRSNSPTNLTRQKSFRKEPSRMLGSPSPSRRFNINDGDKYGSANNSVSKRMINGPKVSASHCVSSSIRKEGFKATSPNSNMSSRRFHNGLRHRESCKAYRVGSKIDETVVNDVLSTNHDMDSIMEDIDNPLISLDCFIFL